MHTPKPIEEISVVDLHEHPVWRYSLESEEDCDETYVVPAPCASIPNDNDLYHVACDLTLSTGRELTGFMSVSNGRLDDEVPIAVGNSGEYWSLDFTPSRRNQEKFKSFFGIDYEQIFPVHWKLRVNIEGEERPMSGTYSKG